MLTLPSQSSAAARRVTLSGDAVFTEQAIALLRRHLRDVGLDEWQIFHGPMQYLYGIDRVLDRLDPDAVWEAADLSLTGDESMIALTFEDEPKPLTRAWPSGALHLRAVQVVVARWYWHDAKRCKTKALYLVAAPRVECVEAFRQRLVVLNRSDDAPFWQIVGEYGDSARVPRQDSDDGSLLLEDALQRRVDTEIIGFFTPPVQAMYERLGVPYRRGVLMYGEPGNGKTSLIRRIGAKLPHVAALMLRAMQDFNTDTLIETFDTWKQLAPAILVIEDLTAVLERVNLSTLLNLLDGVDHKIGGGLMLIASTNHPQKLDAALSNRPGRFDVVFELPSPAALQRRAYFGARLLELDTPTIDSLVESTKGMSFAHLEAILHGSGLIAIRQGREYRTAADVTESLAHVRDACNAANRGYAEKPEAPFGLAPVRKQ